jgi:hypothetical protein
MADKSPDRFIETTQIMDINSPFNALTPQYQDMPS